MTICYFYINYLIFNHRSKAYLFLLRMNFIIYSSFIHILFYMKFGKGERKPRSPWLHFLVEHFKSYVWWTHTQSIDMTLKYHLKWILDIQIRTIDHCPGPSCCGGNPCPGTILCLRDWPPCPTRQAREREAFIHFQERSGL